MNDEYIPSNPWLVAGICFLVSSISSVFAVTSKRKRTYREMLIDATQTGMVGCIICFSLRDYLPFNLVLVLCGILGLSGPSFTMLIITTLQKAFLEGIKSTLQSFVNKIDGDKNDKNDT